MTTRRPQLLRQLHGQVAPEFSCRLLDETYEESNREIARIQGVMVDYFKQRPGPLAKGGLSALQQSMAGEFSARLPAH